MTIQRFYVNPFQEACYVVSGINGMAEGECLIIDCGAYYPEEEEAIRSYIEKSQLSPTAHLLTHGHLDHIFGARFVYETWGLRPILHEADDSLFCKVEEQARMFGIPLMREPLREHLTLASLPSYVGHIHTPGHTQGSVCYCSPSLTGRNRNAAPHPQTEMPGEEAGELFLFSGDTLFQSGVGRTDLPGGNYGQLMVSLGKLAVLNPQTKVLPGHGGATTIGQETEENPYL